MRLLTAALFGDLLDVGTEEDAGRSWWRTRCSPSRRSTRPAAPWPGSAASGRRCRPGCPDSLIGLPPLPRSTSTSLSRSVRSVNRPSTPRSRSSLISPGSSTVQTCTCLPAACALRIRARAGDHESAAAMRHLERRHPTSGEPIREPAARHQRGSRATSAGEAAVGTRPRVSRRNVSDPTLRERADQDPVPRVPRLDEADRAPETAPSDLRSMLNRASGNSSKSRPRVGTSSRPPTSASRTSAYVDRAISPCRSLTRSSTASWNASR